ncbi:hypothetical protein PIB30_092937 [Stylosanthes scabra]|uniref:Putative plant transposon protein domain-containing protein n=1 Tax=Stylosanthes scabra TaxID=79078 RepID=A0ABU6VY72_9FABA|nr:hypothetical protein [Stylosanthes scabra]
MARSCLETPKMASCHVYFLSLNFCQVDAETKGDLSSRCLLSEFKSGHDLEWCCLGQDESHLAKEKEVTFECYLSRLACLVITFGEEGYVWRRKCQTWLGKGVARQPSSRTHGTSSRRQTSQGAERFETPTHAKRGQMLSERKVMHERVINFRGKRYTFQEQIFARGWQFMYDSVVPINMSLVREFYANCDKKNQREVYIRGRKIPCYLGDIEGVLHIPRLKGVSEHNAVGEKYDSNDLDLDEVMRVIGRDGPTWPDVPGRINKNILNKDAWMWMKLVGMTVSLPGVMVTAMYEDPTMSKRQLLPFPMFITKWAAKAGVPTYQGDEIFNVQKAQQFFPYGMWKEERGAVEDPIPPPMPSPVRPPVTRTSTPTPSARSSQ